MSSLNDPEAVLFELFVEDDDPSGMTEDEAYAFLVGADTATSTLPPITTAGFDPDELRGPDGRWIKAPGGSAVSNVGTFVKRFKGAREKKAALKAAQPVSKLGTDDPVLIPATKYYQVHSGGINGDLRRGTPVYNLAGRDQAIIQSLDAGTARSRLIDDVIVYRGVANPDTTFGSAWRRDASNEGLTWRDDGFVSTSVDHRVATVFARGRAGPNPPIPPLILSIMVPKGAGALHVDVGQYNDEGELLLERGAHYRVMRDDGVTNGAHHLLVEMIPAGKPLTASTAGSDDVIAQLNVDTVTTPRLVDAKRLVDVGPAVTIVSTPITAAFWNKGDHPRNPHDGQFIDKIGGSAVADFAKKFTAAARGSTDVRKSAPLDIGGHGPRSKAPDTRYDQAIDTYMSGAYKQINNGLRGNGGKADKLTGAPGASPTAVNGTQAVRGAVAKIDQAMTESRLRSDVVVHRGVVDPHQVFSDHWSDDVTGLSWVDHGFGSSTPDENYARSYAGPNGIMLNILAPAGTPAIFVEETLGGGDTTHHELVLNRGMRYRVVRDQKVKGVRTLDVEVMP